MNAVIDEVLREFHRHKDLADRAMEQLGDEDFFRSPDGRANSAAVIVKHLAGNLKSRWSDFLTTDGEKPSRDRDNEFVITQRDTRESLSAAWSAGWETLLGALAGLSAADLEKTVTIRGEPHTVYQAVVRGLTHAAYHTGQILYLTRWLRPESEWLTIPPGQSAAHQAGYLAAAKARRT